MVKREAVRALIENYTPTNFERVLKEACAPRLFMPVGKDYRFQDVSDVSVRVLGVVKDLPGENGFPAPLLVADVAFATVLTERSSRIRQFKLAKKVLEHFAATPPMELDGVIAQGIFVFHDAQGNFRVSLVTATPEKGKFNWSKARRQSFYVTADPDANATFVQRMCMDWSSLKAIKEAFSVEKLTKEFYDLLFKWYDRACEDERVEYPNGLETDADNREDKNRKHIIRLITRLMFVWFLKQKKLVPDSLFEEKDLKNILKDFDPTSRSQHQYYRAILQNLFFATLNSEIDDRGFVGASNARTPGGKSMSSDYGVKTKYRYADEFAITKQSVLDLFRPIPFLNGGLFECLDQEGDDGRVKYYDGFSRQEHHRDYGTLTWAHVPNDLFFDPDYGIIPLLKRYNFTVEENSPGDEDVALDPELLGKVFENLLGAFNPETEEIVRKSTGSFYTPREIVNYMVDESLIAYLAEKTGSDEKTVRALVLDGVRPTDDALCERLAQSIEKAKILDPACGSGAFPMGALLKMTELLRILRKMPETANLYDLKLKLIENCIFGSDIQEIAVQISKLRVFISLVCEQKSDPTKPNYGINPLPNLETKFVAANSLIGLQRNSQGDLFFDTGDVKKTKDDLWGVRKRHFLAKTRKEKNELRREDKTLREKLAGAARELGFSEESTRLMASWDPYNQNVHAEFFDPAWMFDVENGFDVVIGNPPYIKERDNAKVFAQINNSNLGRKYHCGKMDYWYYFLHRALGIVSETGVIGYITSRYWLNSSGAKKLIRHISEVASFVEVVDIGNLKVFDNVVGHHMISFYRLGKERTKCRYKHVSDDVANIAHNLFDLEYELSNAEMISSTYEIVLEPQCHIRTTKILSDYCHVSQGIVEASDKISIRMYTRNPDSRHHVGEGIFVLTDEELESLKLSNDEVSEIVPYAGDGCIKRYSIDYGQLKHLIYSDRDCALRISTMKSYQNLKQHLDGLKEYITSSNKPYGLHRPRQKEIFLGEKIIGPSMFKHPAYTFDTGNIFVGMSFNVLTAKKGCGLLSILAILNSKYAEYWFYKNAKHRGVGVDVGVDKLRSFPLPDINGDEDILKSLVEKILAAKMHNPVADTAELERKIDNLVYELYGITDEKEIAVIEESFDKRREVATPKGENGKARTPGAQKKRKPKIEEEF